MIGTCWLAWAACGSGNLGKIVQSETTTAPPGPAATPPTAPLEPLDAGKPRVSGMCGDGVIQTLRGEQCDGIDFAGRNCTNLGLGDGFLNCDPQTCRIIATQCTQTGVVLPAPDAGKQQPPVDAGTADAGGTPKGCPAGFYCLASVFRTGEFLCTQFAEEAPPVCLDSTSDTSCPLVLPGSVCTDTTIGAFCMLPCKG